MDFFGVINNFANNVVESAASVATAVQDYAASVFSTENYQENTTDTNATSLEQTSIEDLYTEAEENKKELDEINNIKDKQEVEEQKAYYGKNQTEINDAKNNAEDANNTVAETINEKTEQAMEAHIRNELIGRINEMNAETNSKGFLGKAADGFLGIFGGGIQGEINSYQDMLNKLDDPNVDITDLYKTVFSQEPDISAINQSLEAANELTSKGNITLTDGTTQVTQEDITNKLAAEAQALKNGFNNDVNSQGIISTCIGRINNFIGIGTTENMTNAQMDNLVKSVEDLKNAKTPEEFAAKYTAITGEALTAESLDGLFNNSNKEGENTSKLSNTRASECTTEYKETNDGIKNTATAVVTGMAVAATGPVGAIAIGAAMAVGVNSFDAITQNNGKNPLENLGEYAQTNLVKDAALGAVNGLTGKLGNIAGEKLVGAFANKTLGSVAVNEISDNVSSHMGRFNTNSYSDIVLPLPDTVTKKFIHMCDFLASRKQIHFDFDENNNIVE